MHAVEKQVIVKLLDEALGRGYRVSVWDGEEWVLEGSTDRGDILQNLGATDEEILRFSEDGKRIGNVFLVYGNEPYYVISDHTSSSAMDELLAPVNQLIDELEAVHG